MVGVAETNVLHARSAPAFRNCWHSTGGDKMTKLACRGNLSAADHWSLTRLLAQHIPQADENTHSGRSATTHLTDERLAPLPPSPPPPSATTTNNNISARVVLITAWRE